MKNDLIENRINASSLFSLYGELLTENQKKIVSAYYLYLLVLVRNHV